jgi:hypothetical protein
MEKGTAATPRYQVGQQVRVREPAAMSSDPRDATLMQYSGRVGKVIEYYWINPRFSAVFYLYRIRFGDERDEIVLHEDEIQDFIR